MAVEPTTPRPVLAPVGSFPALAASFRRSLRASNRSAATVSTYIMSVELFRRFLEAHGGPSEPGLIRRAHIEMFMGHLFDRKRKPATVSTRLRGLRAFFTWAGEEGEVEENPTASVLPPRIPEEPVRMPSDADVRKLLAVCDGTGFADRRDRAIVLVFIDCGLRRGELVQLTVSDVDLEQGLLRVLRGKGGAPRVVPMGNACAAAVDRYLRVRARHRLAEQHDALWISPYGALTADGIAKLLAERARAAGIAPLHPHQLRHYSAHRFLAEGGTESSAQRIFGWRGPQMVMRYGSARGVERAIAEHRRIGLADRLLRGDRP